jgi:hypothetical protein
MAQIPTWLIGKNVTAISITPQSVDLTTGTLTAGSNSSLTGLLDQITRNTENTLDLIVPMDTRQDSKTITGTATTLALVQILSTQSSQNVLEVIANSTDYVFVTFTRGGRTFSDYFVCGKYSESLSRGKTTGTLDLEPCGIGYTDV